MTAVLDFTNVNKLIVLIQTQSVYSGGVRLDQVSRGFKAKEGIS